MATDEMTPAAARGITLWTFLAWLTSLGAVAGSLWLSLGMELRPCPLCYYQRTFVMAVASVLTVGLISASGRRSALSLLVVPAAAAALGVAGWHSYLEFLGKLECPKGIFGIGSAPQQSLAALAILFVLVAVDASRSRTAGSSSIPSLAVSLILGGALTYGSIISVPKPEIPVKPYEKQVPDICRPPFRANT